MKRAIVAFGLFGLLSASLLAAADSAPTVSTAPSAGLCAAAAPAIPELPGVAPLFMQTACSAVATCPDGSQVSCSSGTWDLCDTFYGCSAPYPECGVRCLNNYRFCPGFNYNNCHC